MLDSSLLCAEAQVSGINKSVEIKNSQINEHIFFPFTLNITANLKENTEKYVYSRGSAKVI